MFAVLITIVIYMPASGIGEAQDQYINVLGHMWLFVVGGVIANSVAAILNIYFISQMENLPLDVLIRLFLLA